MRQALVVLLALAGLASSSIAANAPDSYVLRDHDITYMLGKGMPAEELKALQGRFGSEFLWARQGGRLYVIRDAATLQKARDAVQTNVVSGPERDKRIADVVAAAVAAGAAQPLP